MRVGFIGIGSMGQSIAQNVATAGHELTVYDIDANRATAFARRQGCRSTINLADIASNEFVVTMLPTGPIVRQVLLEAQDGAFQKALSPGTIAIDMTSSEPFGTRELGAILARSGVALLDAPVSKRVVAFSGSAPGNSNATTGRALVIMLGGDDSGALARARPLVEDMGDTVCETGPLGSGLMTKALNNFVAAAAYASACEAMIIGKHFGLDAAKTVGIFNQSTGQSFAAEIMLKNKVAVDDYQTGFALALMAKDVRIAERLAESRGLNAPMVQLVDSLWDSALQRLGGTVDLTAALDSWEQDLKPVSEPHREQFLGESAGVRPWPV